MLQSSCSTGCKCGSSCLNKPFHRRPVKKMKIVKHAQLTFFFQTEKCGSGIVAEEDINQGEFIIEYVGEVIDDKTCEERLWKMKHRGETNFYLCEINRDMVIDATFKGNKSRYINHSCCPNTEMQKWRIDGETRIGIFATREIKRGEHLTYDYQFVQFGADQNCYCGAAGCRQKLGVKPNKPKLPSSDAALKFVACQVAVTSPKLKAMLSGQDVRKNEKVIKKKILTIGCSISSLSGWQSVGSNREEVYQNGFLHIGSSRHDAHQRSQCSHNCIGEVISIIHPMGKREWEDDLEIVEGENYEDGLLERYGWRSFGIVRRFDNHTRKHLIMFEDGRLGFLDMSKEDWEICSL
ncbi:hypothetical protein RJ640_029946 [Escallonia rubra]|uniref:Histone-lysine N-methyltransferase ASHH3 n=1 Tax=Escallonia rubra TaxID=112253 RepID=A0AA88RMG2_9ASTE|nr:hypothetical protein RJ640_029946 [Escallonia rubra]